MKTQTPEEAAMKYARSRHPNSIVLQEYILKGAEWQRSQPPYNAAEEMLEALKSVLWLKDLIGYPDKAPEAYKRFIAVQEVLEKIESAIKKAEGL